MVLSLILILPVIFSISGCIQQEKTNGNHTTNNNTTLYVGITHSDYRTIQEAIDAAINGTTIIIKNGTYNEHLNINKSIHLSGEDKNTTIIDFSPNIQINQVPIITINADNCSIENLQITLSNNYITVHGIGINSKQNTIKNNIITGVGDGIDLSVASGFNTILHNEIRNNQIGIMVSDSKSNTLSNNILSNSQYNIFMSVNSDKNNVSFNVIRNSDYGIRITGSEFNTVYKNCIENNNVGLYCCCGAQSNYFYDNSLVNNSETNAKENSGLVNIWYNSQTGTGNYWNDYNGSDINKDGVGDTAYRIESAGNTDMYPLMIPPLDVPCNK